MGTVKKERERGEKKGREGRKESERVRERGGKERERGEKRHIKFKAFTKAYQQCPHYPLPITFH